MRRIMIIILMNALISACGLAIAGTPESQPTEPPSEVVVQKTGGAAIIFSRSGGFAGISEEWTIYPDGRIVFGEDQEYWISAEQVSILLETIEALGFFELSEPSGLPGSCKDCFTYQITVSFGEQFKSVTFEDGAPSTSDNLLEIVTTISSMLESASE